MERISKFAEDLLSKSSSVTDKLQKIVVSLDQISDLAKQQV